MKYKSILAAAILIGLLIGSCSLFEKEKDNKKRNLGLLLLLGSGSTSSDCTGASGMVICIPKGIAE